MPSELRTARLHLRSWRADDAQELAPILERDVPHLSPWIPARVAEPASVADLVTRLSGFAADFAAARAFRYALFDSQRNELLGEIDLFPRNASGRVAIDESDRAEVGYWLRSDRTGQGFATEAVREVIDAAMALRRFAHIEIRCDARNVRSAALPARMGFVLSPDIALGGQSNADDSVWLLSLGERGGAT
jgi:RimJ/RimL family protein N-acetyltransferase